MESRLIFIIEDRSSDDPPGRWRPLEAGDSIDILKARWERNWYWSENDSKWYARKRYTNSPSFQSLRIRGLNLYSQDWAALAAQLFKEQA